MFTDALLASGDTFVCDFVLGRLIGTKEAMDILEREDFDFISGGKYRLSSNNNKRYPSSNKMEDFLKSTFMTPLPEFDEEEDSTAATAVFARGLRMEESTRADDSFRKEAQSMTELSKTFPTEAKFIRDELHNFCSQLSKNPLQTDSAVNDRVYPWIDDESKRTTMAIKEMTAKNRFWVTEEHEVQPTNEESNKGYNFHLSYVHENIAHLRLKERKVQLKVNKLLRSKRMRFLNTMYNFHLMGFFMFDMRHLIVEMQLSHRYYLL